MEKRRKTEKKEKNLFAEEWLESCLM